MVIELAHETERLISVAAEATGIAEERIREFLVEGRSLSASEVAALTAWAGKRKTAFRGLALGQPRVRR